MIMLMHRKDDHGHFEVSSEYGTLCYDPDQVELSADGDLPPWSVAESYAVHSRDVLADRGETALWKYLESHYRHMLGDLYESDAAPYAGEVPS